MRFAGMRASPPDAPPGSSYFLFAFRLFPFLFPLSALSFYVPWNRGKRFSKNAFSPSAQSSD
jgi:hypothetical protein